jgi:hypothetical protein
MGLHEKVDGDGLDGPYPSVSPLLDGKATVPLYVDHNQNPKEDLLCLKIETFGTRTTKYRNTPPNVGPV